MVLTFEIVDELLKCDDLNQYFPAVLFIFQKFLKCKFIKKNVKLVLLTLARGKGHQNSCVCRKQCLRAIDQRQLFSLYKYLSLPTSRGKSRG